MSGLKALELSELADDSLPPHRRFGPYRIVLIVSLLLAVATYAVQLLLGVVFGQILQTAILQGLEQYQLYSLLDTAVFLVFNPVICFLVFYRVGSMLTFPGGPSYFRLLKYAFVGGLLGYALCFFGSLAYGIYTDYAGVSSADWLVISVDLVIGAIRGSADILFLAFTGIVVGLTRAAPTMPEMVAPEPATSAADTEA